MTRTRIVTLLALLIASLAASVGSTTAPGKLVGAEPFEIPDWFKQSFLDIADDATEAAAANRHGQ